MQEMQEIQLDPCVGMAPTQEGNGNPLQYSCLENAMGGGAWWAIVHGVAKSWTQLSNFTFTFHFHALEKEMATHSSILAWKTPCTVELGGLQSMGLQGVGYDYARMHAGMIGTWRFVTLFSLLLKRFNRKS